jgi:hypothetical protein
MKARFVPALLAVWLLFCASQLQQPVQTTAAPAPTALPASAIPAPGPSDAQIASGRWDVDRVLCSDLLGAADDDRAAAAMFYYGYLAAKAGIPVIDVGKVMKQCAATPSITEPQAFHEALTPGRSPG